MRKTSRQKLWTILVMIVIGIPITLFANSKAMSDEHYRIPVFSIENLRGTARWWLYGAPFYLFLIFAPGKDLPDNDEEGAKD